LHVFVGTAWIAKYDKGRGNLVNKVLYWQEQRTQSPQVFILILSNILPIYYAYSSFVKFRKLGSKHSLGSASVFIIFFSFLAAVGIFHLFQFPLTLVVSEVIPFLFVVMGMENYIHLARLATTSLLQEFQRNFSKQSCSRLNRLGEIRIFNSIAKSYAACFTSVMVDGVLKTVGIVLIQGLYDMGTSCLLACVSLLISHVLFNTFFLAVLALKLENMRLMLYCWLTKSFFSHSTSSLEPADSLLPNHADAIDNLETESIVSSKGKLIAIFLGIFICYTMFNSAIHQDDSPALGLPLSDLRKYYEEQLFGDVVLSFFEPAISILMCSSPLKHCPQRSRSLFTIQALLVNFMPFDVSNLLTYIPRVILLLDTEALMVLILFGLVLFACFKYIFLDKSCGFLEQLTTQLKNSPSTKEFSESKLPATVDLPVNTKPQESTDAICSFPLCKFVIGTDSPVDSARSSLYDLPVLAQASSTGGIDEEDSTEAGASRPLSEVWALFNKYGASSLSDREILLLVKESKLPAYKLEKVCDDALRGIKIRRNLVREFSRISGTLDGVPFLNMDYKALFLRDSVCASYKLYYPLQNVLGVCCENIIGYIPVPVGVVGPLTLNGSDIYVPMSTTEGCLLASTHRGCKAVKLSGGVTSVLLKNGMTRAPVVKFSCVTKCLELIEWLRIRENYESVKSVFESTSRFAKLLRLSPHMTGRMVYLRFRVFTGDAMGMNMISKGTEKALEHLQNLFPDMRIISLSGNFCTDKKPAAVNWIQGRGKSVVSEAIIKKDVVENLLKTTVAALVELNTSKNLIGSAIAGSLGGFNAHAANIVTAIFIATGQDPAQNVESSNCLTFLEAQGDDLYISCTMPSVEVGTVGGGTQLPAQASCLSLLGVEGPCKDHPGEHAAKLALVVGGAVLAGELSLLSALASGHLVQSHMTHNRSSQNLAGTSAGPV
ncbi:hypothetical protein Zmor_019115, partial [Zophobas morio]